MGSFQIRGFENEFQKSILDTQIADLEERENEALTGVWGQAL